MSITDFFSDSSPTQSQIHALSRIEHFLRAKEPIFIMKGYAGSGKTTILKALVQHLDSLSRHFILMAPTGRAAKVICDKTGHKASTIHRGIYSFHDLKEAKESESFKYYYALGEYQHSVGTVYIIDEASMVSNQYSEGEFFRFGSGYLLSDLIAYTGVQRQNTNTKIIFIGDPCQLPPVGDNSSKALDGGYLKREFGLDSSEAELTEVKRHDEHSGLLQSSMLIRKSITSGHFNYFNLAGGATEVAAISPELFLDKWGQVTGSKIIVTYKNKTAFDLNAQIRSRIYGVENATIQEGDTVILAANNPKHNVLNGEFAIISDSSPVTESRTIYIKGAPPITLTWRKIGLIAPDVNGSEKCVNGLMLENFLYGEQSNLTPEETQALYVDFKNRHPKLKPESTEFKETIRTDEYFNCLKIKYGHAVTCHKAQGGEWDSAFIMWDYSQGQNNEGFFRWAYTAVTRASSSLFSLNPPCFTPYSGMMFADVAVQESLDRLSGKSAASADEAAFTEDMAELLDRAGLGHEPLSVQDHFLRVHIAAQRTGIELSGWQRLNYEIRYKFQKGSENAVFKTFINGKNEFKKPFTFLPPQPIDSGLKSEVSMLLASLPEIRIQRVNDMSTEPSSFEQFAVPSDIEFDPALPFTEALYRDMLNVLVGTRITIQDIEHVQYKERYRFVRGEETCVVDFNYNGAGFFGKIEPLPKRSNSPALLSVIKKGIQSIKECDHACQRN